MDLPILFYILLPIIAALYASVGHGGASGYLALMALFGTSTLIMKPTALLLNIFVSGISFFLYLNRGHFKWKLFFPFALTSIPAAFLGGYLEVDPTLYKRILGFLLIFSVLRIMGWIGKENKENKEVVIWQSALIGLVIGLFSGLIGIGGGIILSPIILILHWGNMKETAAVSSLFIWVNSLAALLGMYTNGWTLSTDISILVVLAVFGGILGAYFGSSKFDNVMLKRILALVLVIASVKLIFS